VHQPICNGPWPPDAPLARLAHPLLSANIDITSFSSLQSFCTAPVPTHCRCAFDGNAQTAHWKVQCDEENVPDQHMWGFLYAIAYCEQWCNCVNVESLPLRVPGLW